jgi:hypothetical protein
MATKGPRPSYSRRADGEEEEVGSSAVPAGKPSKEQREEVGAADAGAAADR